MVLLKKLRLDNDVTQRSLWLKTGIDPSLISKAERYGMRMNDKHSRAIADALGWDGDPAELFKEVPHARA